MSHLSMMIAAVGITSAAFARSVTPLSGGWTCDGEPVTVPHTWNAIDAADGEGRAPDWVKVGYSAGATSYVRKVVSYRRALPDPTPGKRQFIRGGGAACKCEVKVNGVSVGKHIGAFTAYAFEATEAMKPTDNELEIVVDSRVDWDVQPIHADFSVYGGLYRLPEMVETDPVCIDLMTDGADGVIIDADAKTGEVVAQVNVLGGTNEVQRFQVKDFELWSPENPKLYPITIAINQLGSHDELTLKVGFRTVEFRDDGFYLNGIKRKLRGVNRHQDRRGRGWCRNREDEREDVVWIKKMGADAVRTSHYPQSRNFYELCDEMGLLVWTEVPNVNGLTLTEQARQNGFTEAREMVAQNRNHACIFVWGIFNELYNKIGEAGSYEPRMVELRDYVKTLDPTRTVVAASCKPEKRELNAIPEQVGFNLYPGWYGHRSLDMDSTLVNVFTNNPTRKMIAVSEYGGGGCISQHGDAMRQCFPQAPWHTEEYQAYHHWGNYSVLNADKRIWGTFIWVMFDLGTDARREGAEFGMNDKGMVTWDRSTAKDAFYLYQANWTKTPVLRLVGQRMTETTQREVTVMAFSNLGKVSLYLNGQLYSEREPDAVKTVIWENVPLNEGENAIEIRAGSYNCRARWTVKKPEFPKVGKATRLTSGPKDHLLANYFAINAWSKDQRYVAALETELNGRLPEANERAVLGIVDTQNDNKFIPITTTGCWNFQEGTMFHWLDWADDTFIFNDMRDGRFVAVVMNWKTKAERVIPHPISAVSKDGKKAISINYARLYLTRPDYGYAGGGQDDYRNQTWPENDGLWSIDLVTGAAKLILPVVQARELMPAVTTEDGKPGHPLAYFCHTVFNPSASRIFFLARSVNWFDAAEHKIPEWQTTAFTVKADGSDLRRCFPGRDWGGSHFNWLNDEEMVVTVYPQEIGKYKCWHVTFKVGDELNPHRLAPGLLDWDGHCVYSPDGKWMSTEGYFDGSYMRNWVLMRVADEAVMPVGSFKVPEAYRGGFWRCDLHARWRPDGKQLAFDSVHEGTRQIYTLDLEISEK